MKGLVETVKKQGKYIVDLYNKVKSIEATTDSMPYKVYTALLTQYGSDEAGTSISNGDLTIGVTYQIYDFGGAQDYDFTNVGAPNNNIETYFVATGTTPNSWGVGVGLVYVPAAPIVTVLENTIGNIWFKYEGVGFYSVNSNGLFVTNKTYQNPINYCLPSDITEGYDFKIQDENAITLLVFQGGVTQDWSLVNLPIEIRVYN